MLQHYTTDAGVQVEFQQQALTYANAINPLIKRLDECRGAIFASSFEFPGRYTCWDIGFCNPPLAISSHGLDVTIEALNLRGEKLLKMLQPRIKQASYIINGLFDHHQIKFSIQDSDTIFTEEERSHQPSVFSLIRDLIALFKSPEDNCLGLYGSFAYDLVFQFEQLAKNHERANSQRDMVLYLPDEIYVVNHRKEEAFIRRYDFSFNGTSTQGLVREGQAVPYQASKKPDSSCDHLPGEYAALVNKAKQKFKRGDLFEVVPSQTFYESFDELPSDLFMRMKEVNPSPYGFFINLGNKEYLVGASPEMYVKVTADRVETCPISGTIKRGVDAIEDAKNIQTLLDSEKETSELTMCTDVDRNDKSRICQAGSVQVIGRRQIEMYSRLIHTVDHVEGRLREGFDAVDAFLTHMWVVTVTGAPKLWAMNFIEQNEKSSRGWYAGAVGWFHFNGNLNTGLVLRTVNIAEGIAKVRVGATLLYDSEPEAEEQETRLKASAFLDLVRNHYQSNGKQRRLDPSADGKRVLIIDHQDSFVHTLANYFRQTGAVVTTIRADKALSYINKESYDCVVLSPGPGLPSDFNLNKTIARTIEQSLPLFGVCLGLQGIIEYFGGKLSQLDYPMHGKPSTVKVNGGNLFDGLPNCFTAGRYHSIHAVRVPDELIVTAETEDGIVMAIEHQNLPVYAVQFHPETIMSMDDQIGLKIIDNMMKMVSLLNN